MQIKQLSLNVTWVRKWKQRILKQKISKHDDTCRVSLYKGGKGKTFLVHRLVAEAFIPKLKGKNYINHIDGSRLNNTAFNLEWCDHTENNNHAFDNGLIKTGHRCVLINKETGEEKEFRSLTKASEFLGMNYGHFSRYLKLGKTEFKNHVIKECDKE